MNQETAKRLLVEGGTFIFLDVPEGTEFGIDMKSYNTGENFRGVKMIPAGLHYIFYSGVGKYGEIAPRVGFFYNFKRSEVLVRKWDKQAGDMSTENVSEQEIVNLKDNIMVLDKFLGPYPFDIHDKWKGLTSHITENLTILLSPISKLVRSALELQSCKDADRPRVSAETTKTTRRSRLNSSDDTSESDYLPDLKPVAGTELRLSKFPDKNYPDGSTASEITHHCLDSTYVLETLASKHKFAIDLVGEIEFCFICFLAGHSLEAFDHWKKLVSLLCSCEAGIKKFRGIYDAFITLLETQIKEIPEEFLADIVDNNNFIYVKLRNLFRAIVDSEVDGRLKTKVARFKEDLTMQYGWDFSHLNSEDEEDAPVIVDIRS